MTSLLKRSLNIAGHRTSLALEAEFWAALEEIAAHAGETLPTLVARIDAARAAETPGRGLASALRVYALNRRAQRP